MSDVERELADLRHTQETIIKKIYEIKNINDEIYDILLPLAEDFHKRMEFEKRLDGYE